MDDERWSRFEIKKNQFDNEMKRLDSIKLKPVKETNAKVEEMGFKPLTDAVTAKGNSFAVQKFLTKMWWPSSDQLLRTWMTRLSN